MAEAVPRASGVYQILCVPTGKIYVGSSVDLRQQWYAHLSLLRKGNHHNHHLQNAWNKYGENKFSFTVLALAKPDNLLQVEQKWLDRLGCASPDVGFNICPTAVPLVGINVRVWKGFINPDGEEVAIINLHDFCRKNNLHVRTMQELASGKSRMRSYIGWTHKNSLHRREHIKTFEGFIDPQGHPVGPITNLFAFCRKHGLDDSSMYDIAYGRSCSYRGWTYQNGKKSRREKTYRRFVNPEGVQVTITNLRAFCREHELSIAQMRQLVSGRRARHKGWTWREEGESG
jgi:group I intron endonuclease